MQRSTTMFDTPYYRDRFTTICKRKYEIWIIITAKKRLTTHYINNQHLEKQALFENVSIRCRTFLNDFCCPIKNRIVAPSSSSTSSSDSSGSSWIITGVRWISVRGETGEVRARARTSRRLYPWPRTTAF